MTTTNINFPILELAFIHRTDYPNGEGYHFNVSYLLDVNGSEVVMNCFPTTKEQLLQLPLIDETTMIAIFQERGISALCTGLTTVGDL